MDELRPLALSAPNPFVAAGTLQVQAECALHLGRPQEALTLFECAGDEYAAVGIQHRLAQAQAGAQRALEAR